MNAKIHPFCISVNPRPPFSTSIAVNSMKVPCIILKPTMNKKLAKIKLEIWENLVTLIKLSKIFLISLKGDSNELFLDFSGRLSGNQIIANNRDISERILENIQGNR